MLLLSFLIPLIIHLIISVLPLHFKHTIMAEFMVDLVDSWHFNVVCSCVGLSCHVTRVISSHVHHAAITEEGRNCPFFKKNKKKQLSVKALFYDLPN